MPVEIALNAYVLPDDHKVFKFFPGKSYKFYEAIFQTSVAVMDIRGLDRLGTDTWKWRDKDILNIISEDRVNRSVERGAPRPKKLINSSSDKASLTFLKNLLFIAEKGDLIAMPDKGYSSLVRIGELTDDPGTAATISVKDGGTTSNYYGRRVRWIASIEKRLISSDLVAMLHSLAAFFDIGKSNYEEIYQLAFDNYVQDGQFVATFRTSKQVFTSKDNLLSSVWFELFEVIQEAIEKKQTLQLDNIYELAIESDINADERDDLSISVQSPGWFRLRSIVKTPFVTMAVFALAVQGITYDDALAASVSANVIREADSRCLGEVDASVREYLELLGKERWEQACKLAVRAKSEATLSTDATLKNSPKSAKHRK